MNAGFLKIMPLAFAIWASFASIAFCQDNEFATAKVTSFRAPADNLDPALKNIPQICKQQAAACAPPCETSLLNNVGQTNNQEECFAFPLTSKYYFRADGGAMLRSQASDRLYQVYNPVYATSPTKTQVGRAVDALALSDLPPNLSMAGNFLLGKTLDNGLQLECQYTAARTSSATACAWNATENRYGVAGNMFSPFNNFGGMYGWGWVGVDYNKYAEIRLESSFQTVDLNLRRPVTQLSDEHFAVSFLFGIRYAGMPERFGYFTVSDVNWAGVESWNGSICDIQIATNNDLIGPQIGAVCDFRIADRWICNVETKVAVLNNHCVERSYCRMVDDGREYVYISCDEGNNTSFLADINVNICRHWSPRLTTRIGYRAVVITDLALASESLSSKIEPYMYEMTQLHNKSTAVYHGPFAGLEYRF